MAKRIIKSDEIRKHLEKEGFREVSEIDKMERQGKAACPLFLFGTSKLERSLALNVELGT